MPDGYTPRPWRGRTALGCDSCAYATTMLSEMQKHLHEVHRQRPRRRPRAAAPTLSPEVVEFASPEAAEVATRDGVTPLMLRAHAPSGKHGYTVADVVRATRTATE